MAADDAAQQQSPDAALANAYVAHKMAGLSDLDAALKARDSLRQNAEARSSFRDAADIATRRPLTGDSLRTQLMGEADQPIKDAQMRAQAGYAQALADPSHPANRALQAQLAKAMPSIPPEALGRLTVGHMDQLGPQFKELADQAKSMADANATNIKAPKEADKLKAEAERVRGLLTPEIIEKLSTAGKTDAETERLRKLINPDVLKALADARNVNAEAGTKEAGLPSAGRAAAAAAALKEQEARNVGATAGKTELETGGVVSTGRDGGAWKVRGDIGVDQKARDEFKNKLESTDKIGQGVDEILGILGDQRLITNPEQRAKVQPRLAQLTEGLIHDTGQRGLQLKNDGEFFSKMTGDPTKFSIGNLTGWAHAKTRLETIKQMANEDLQRHAQTHGIEQVGGQAPSAGGLSLSPGETAQLRKIAADPKDPRASAAVKRLVMAGMK